MGLVGGGRVGGKDAEYVRSGGGFRLVGDGGKKGFMNKILLFTLALGIVMFGYDVGSVSAVQLATDDAKMDYD